MPITGTLIQLGALFSLGLVVVGLFDRHHSWPVTIVWSAILVFWAVMLWIAGGHVRRGDL